MTYSSVISGTPPLRPPMTVAPRRSSQEKLPPVRPTRNEPSHETTILQYMADYGADFRILEEPLLITGIGAAFSVNDNRGLAQELTDTFAQMRQDGTMQEIVGRYLEHPETYLEVECLEQ